MVNLKIAHVTIHIIHNTVTPRMYTAIDLFQKPLQ